MKNIPIFIATLTVLILINWATPPPKDGAIFYGTLTTQQDNTFKVDEISIGKAKKTKQIPMYERPKKKGKIQKNGNKIMLIINPKTDLAITYIDLNEVSEINIPKPDEKWVYKKEKGYREIEYIEIVVISKNIRKTKNRYLIKRDTDVYCSGINEAGKEEKKVPLAAINRLIIDGYYSKQNDGEMPPVKKMKPEKRKKEKAQKKVPISKQAPE